MSKITIDTDEIAQKGLSLLEQGKMRIAAFKAVAEERIEQKAAQQTTTQKTYKMRASGQRTHDMPAIFEEKTGTLDQLLYTQRNLIKENEGTVWRFEIIETVVVGRD